MKQKSKKLIAVIMVFMMVLLINTMGASASFMDNDKLQGLDFLKGMKVEANTYEIYVEKFMDTIKNRGSLVKEFVKAFVANEKIMSKDTANRTLDLELRGQVKVSDNCAIYQLVGKKVFKKTFGDILVGSQNIYVLFDTNKQAKLIIIDGAISISNIRVGISTTAFDTMDLSTVEIVSKDGFKLTDKKANMNFDIEPNASVSFSVDSTTNKINIMKSGVSIYTSQNRLYAVPVGEASMIQITSIRRAYGIPSYRGVFEISMSSFAQGKLRLINELSMEKYLYQVVPSEMPASFGLEALKAQAVAARTYAINECFVNTGLANQGIFVYDSVLSQVYNNSAENALTNQAVDETSGMILMKDGKYVDCRYYSTSGGFGASMHEVWADPGTKAFPATPVSYLMARSYTYDPSDNTKMFSMDTQDEAAINAFYKNLSYTGYDSESYYSRWKVSLTKQELENTINKNVGARYAADPLFVLTKDESGNFVSKPIPAEGIGTFNNMYVSKRGAGGNMMELVIEGSTGTYKIIKEYNIRFSIRPSKTYTGLSTDVLAYRAKGGSANYDAAYTLKNPSILYSAFCTFDIEKGSDGNILSVTFYGGGNGHGVGMSQYGASCLGLQKGFSYDRILTEYYGGSVLTNTYTSQDETSIFDKLFRIFERKFDEQNIEMNGLE